MTDTTTLPGRRPGPLDQRPILTPRARYVSQQRDSTDRLGRLPDPDRRRPGRPVTRSLAAVFEGDAELYRRVAICLGCMIARVRPPQVGGGA